MDQAITGFLGCRRIAVVGFSRNERKFGNAAYAALQEHGYDVFAVNRSGGEIRGVTCHPALTPLRGRIDGVFVSIPASGATTVLDEAAAIGVSHVWLQQGASSPGLVRKAKELGLAMVSGKCLLMYLEPVRSIHRIHRAVVGLFGKL